jgi:Tol biopolymer transport system component
VIPTDVATSSRPRWLPSWLAAVTLAVAMFVFGVGVYNGAGLLKAGKPHVVRPNQVPAPALPGTLYVAQDGAIYRFRNGTFAQITTESGWTQPAVSPDGRELAAIRRYGNWSDLYLMTPSGHLTALLTHDYSPQTESNHWVFYPRFSPDGRTLFYDFDPKDPYNSYRVDLAIFASPSNPSSQGSIQWTYPNYYTGGDVYPSPLAAGGLIYSKYSIDDRSQVHSQVWLQSRPGSTGVALTDPALDCGQAALSADQKLVAMVCTKGQTQSTELDVATFDPTTSTLGTPSTLVMGELVASPVFSPNGKGIAYLAPATPGGMFQLWSVQITGAPAPRELTSQLALDSTSPPVWTAG